jgi:alpha-N-arabinofuranosidase
MACQFNSGELAPMSELGGYIQDALDLIEYANGPVDSPWGARRAAAGHPKPFGLRYLGVGNEQWGPQYLERYERFHQVFKERHPEIRLVASAGPAPADDRFKLAWARFRELKADVVDEHCYAEPRWFYDSATRYDGYDRNGPKVFMGEYAAQSVGVAKPDNRNTWACALSEAAFLTGIERNADVVEMSSYAPLFGHLEGWQWTPNLIWFDNLRVYGTPNYYVQQLFGVHQGACVVPVTLGGEKDGLYAVASRDAQGREVILKLVNASDQPRQVRLTVEGVRRVGPNVRWIELSATHPEAENSLARPGAVVPVEQRVKMTAPDWALTLAAQSLTVLRLPIR